jgi:hypothetical protein
MRLRLRRTIGGAIGKDHHGHEQGQWQKDSNGGTVEGEHGFCSSGWIATYRTEPVRKTGQNRIHCLALLDNPR